MLNFSFASLPSTSDNLANASLSIKDWANWSFVRPAAFAIASCWIAFILAKSADVPTWFAISSAAPAISLFKAKVLAFSKFKSFPVNSSALNSFSIEDSNWSKLSAIAAACSRFKPTALAFTADSANASALPFKDNFKEADAFTTSFSTCFSFITKPLREAYALAPPSISFVLSSNDLPFIEESLFNSANCSLEYPACSRNLVAVIKSFSFNLALDPRDWPMAIYVSCNPLVVTAASPDNAAIFPNSLRVFKASP